MCVYQGRSTRRRFSFLWIGPVGGGILAACGAFSSPHPTAEQDIPFDLIKKLAVDMSRWHFNGTDEIDEILAGAKALGITLSAEDLNSILDEDERKRLWRIGAAEYHIGVLYGEEAQVVFKVHHYVSLAGLWAEMARHEPDPTVIKGNIMVVAGNIGIAAQAVREVPSRWDCWDVAGCEPRPPMRPVTFRLVPPYARNARATFSAS